MEVIGLRYTLMLSRKRNNWKPQNLIPFLKGFKRCPTPENLKIMSDNKGFAVNVVDNDDYGAVLICKDFDIADDLEDFLTEDCFVFFNIKIASDNVLIYFGQASSVERVRALYDRFILHKNRQKLQNQ